MLTSSSTGFITFAGFISPIVFILLSICYNGRWLNWLVESKKMGMLLLEIERPAAIQNIGLGICFLLIALAGGSTFFLSNSYQPLENGSEAASLRHLTLWSLAVFCWSITIYYLVVLISKHEIRENGICFAPVVLQWRKIKSYRWDPLESTRLIMRVKNRFLFIFPFTSTVEVGISAKYRENIDQILETYLPDKRH